MTNPFQRFDDERAALVAAGEKEPLKVMRLARVAAVAKWVDWVNSPDTLHGNTDLALATAELTLFLAWERGLGT